MSKVLKTWCTLEVTGKARLLREIWTALTRQPRQPFPKASLVAFLPQEVYSSAAVDTTVEDLLRIVQEKNAWDDSLDLARATLKRDWRKLRSETKVVLISAFNESGVGGNFQEFASLCVEDEQALKIQWHIEDSLYSESKRKAYEDCYEWGLDMKHRRVYLDKPLLIVLDECARTLCDLIRTRINFDLAVVFAAVPECAYRFFDEVRFRADKEYLCLLVSLKHFANRLRIWRSRIGDLRNGMP